MALPPTFSAVPASAVPASARAVVLALLLTPIACDDDGTGTGPEEERGEPGVHIVAGAGVTDSIDAEPTQALVVEVFDEDGHAAVGAVVRFETVDWAGPAATSPAWTATSTRSRPSIRSTNAAGRQPSCTSAPGRARPGSRSSRPRWVMRTRRRIRSRWAARRR